jgi:hypothetical protein
VFLLSVLWQVKFTSSSQQGRQTTEESVVFFPLFLFQGRKVRE